MEQSATQQIKLESFLAVKTIQGAVNAVRDEASGGFQPFEEYPERPNGGKWYAMGSRYASGYSTTSANTYQKYCISGEAKVTLNDYCGLAGITLCEYDCDLGKTHQGYNSLNYMKHPMNPFTILIVNFLSLANMEDESTTRYMLGSLDEMHNFVQKKIYDIYLSESKRRRLKNVPKNWKSKDCFINPDAVKEYGCSFPYVYDIIGMHRLYDLKNPEVDEKINAVISYISTDEFHHKISDGYRILVEEDGRYLGMGWDPKYPGWFDLPGYMETGNVPKLLFFAQYISKYPVARKTKWFADLLNYIEKYKTKSGTYLFPATWLKESTGYAVQGHHMSFGENRRKKNWREIESTYYVQLLQKNLCN